MPELPEVETTKRGITPHLLNQRILSIIIRNRQLRWPIPKNFKHKLKNQTIHAVTRRGKYLLIETSNGTIIIHLGMSGYIRIVPANTPINKHDHVDIHLSNDYILRFNDQRRFGVVLLTDKPLEHRLIAHLGPEPLTRTFTGNYLFQQSRQRNVPIKTFIMNSKVVVGVGNIYANEALFATRIHPETSAKDLNHSQCAALVKQCKLILKQAITSGGTTIKDFLSADGKPGYFVQKLNVYGRKDLPCKKCKTLLKEIRLAQRSTIYCPICQKLPYTPLQE